LPILTHYLQGEGEGERRRRRRRRRTGGGEDMCIHQNSMLYLNIVILYISKTLVRLL